MRGHRVAAAAIACSTSICLGAIAAGAQAKPGPVTSVEVTFSGHGTGKMTADVNHQVWKKSVDWTLKWLIRGGNQGLQSKSQDVSGTSSWEGDHGFPPVHDFFCQGGVTPTGVHANLGIFAMPAGGIFEPKQTGLEVKGFPTRKQQRTARHWGEIQVSIFGNVDKGCFGPATMAVTGGSFQQEDLGVIYAVFPFNLSDPAAGRYRFEREWSDTTVSSSCDYLWNATVSVSVHRARPARDSRT